MERLLNRIGGIEIVGHVFDAAKVLESIQIHRPDIVFLDIQMPGKDGIELCLEIRKIPYLSDSIISFFTARSESEIKEQALDCGAQGYITKPIRPGELINKIHELVQLFIYSPSSKHK
jgi:two-component system alkaline phosphatase synthesis response regulator PhoP